jgi:hypothetical protein
MPTETINITGSNVTSSQDTNVLLSLGGTPTGAALEPFSINVSWSGQLSAARGGTGLSGIGTSLQLLRTNTLATGLEYFSASTSDIPEGSNLYFTEARTRSTTLTGLNITGTAIVSTDTILEALGKTQNQINSLLGGVNYQGTWNATTNIPAIVSGVGTKGYYFVVSVAGSTNIDGITDWKLGDWIIFNGSTWQKVDNTDAVISVNGYTGSVVLVKADVGLGNVEDTALSTWSGSINITTLGTIATGTWNAGVISKTYGGTGVNIATQALTLGTASANAGSIVFQNATNANTLTINSGVVSASYSLTLPTAQGGANTYLKNDGAGVLSWATVAGGVSIGDTIGNSPVTGSVLMAIGTTLTQSISYRAQQATPFSTAFGFESHSSGSFSGIRNTSYGYQSGKGITSGTNNTNDGYLSGTAISTGSRNTNYGSRSGEGITTQNDNTCIGYLNGIYGPIESILLGSGAGFSTGVDSVRSIVIATNPDLNNLSSIDCINIAYRANTPTASHQGLLGSNHANGYIDNWYFNGITHTAPYSVTLRGSGGSGSNVGGANVTIGSGLNTGTGAGTGTPSKIILSTSTILASGSTAGTLVARLTLSSGAVTTDASTATWADALDFVFGSTTGTKFGTATTQKLAFWNATPIVQITTAVGSATFASSGGGTQIKTDDTFDGYTLQQVVKALRNLGLFA